MFSGLQLFGIGMMIKMFNPELIYFIHCFCWMILVEFYLYTVLLLYEFIIIDFRSSNKIESNHVDDEFGINMCFVFFLQASTSLTCLMFQNIIYFEKKKNLIDKIFCNFFKKNSSVLVLILLKYTFFSHNGFWVSTFFW